VAWASVGTFVGPEFTASLGNYPYPSSKGVGCDKCHMVDSNLYLIMKDLFFKHYVFGIGGPKPLTTVILAFSYKLVLGKLCLIRLENFVACGDRCCPPGVVCGPDKRCQAPGLCLSGCCGDNDCIRPSVCKSSTGLADSQCQCPYECCADGDCTIDGEFCDGITHQCTNESHVSIVVIDFISYIVLVL